ncbi:MAG: hypothetical protein GY950_19030 [bacterium]|nr:hypothetical protein [bacterium]
MRIYDRKGKLIIPPPPKKAETKGKEKGKDAVLVKECFCSNGHNLIGERVMFNGLPGIYLKARCGASEGFIGLSPVYGEKCRISLDLSLAEGKTAKLVCPTCNYALPVFSPCSCGGNIVALFLNDQGDFSDCIGICNRVGCTNAAVKSEGELLSLTMVDSSGKKAGMINRQRPKFPSFAQ